MNLSIDRLRELGLSIPNHVTSAELVEGRADLRHEAQDECPVCGEPGGYCTGLLRLRTATGTLGGAVAGFLCRVHLACADWTDPSIATVDLRADPAAHDAPCCEDCYALGVASGASGAAGWDSLAHAEGECWSCAQSAQEAEDRAREDAEGAAALEAAR